MRRRQAANATTTILRELHGTELEIQVECWVRPGERQWFDADRGVGHPGRGLDVEVLSATLDGQPIALTEDEIEWAADTVAEKADEIFEDIEADRADFLYACWKDRQIE